MNRLSAIIPALFLAFVPLKAQVPQSHGRPTEQVVIEYERLVENGAFLTSGGWKTAGQLYDHLPPFPRDGVISLMLTGGLVGETWVNGNSAEVETKWTNFLGTIDSELRYAAPKPPAPVMTIFIFRLVYTNKQRDIGENGKTIREWMGPWKWKIEEQGPPIGRWTTVSRAIEYVAHMRDKTVDPIVKRNADKTIIALKHLRNGCGIATAC